MAWKLPIGEAKEILTKIARKTRQDPEALDWNYSRLPEPVQDFWINSFGDIVTPGSPNDDLFVHPRIEVREPHEMRNQSGYINWGRDPQFVVRSDRGSKTVLHEGAHYGDKARGSAKSFIEGDIYAHPRFESADWLPRTAQESPILAADVDRLFNNQNNYAYPDRLAVARPLSPTLAMSYTDLTKPTSVSVFTDKDNHYLWQDLHGLDYFRDARNRNEISAASVATEGLAQWLAELPTMDGLDKLDLSKRIIERLEDDPRRKFKIDFNKFMEEPDVLPPW